MLCSGLVARRFTARRPVPIWAASTGRDPEHQEGGTARLEPGGTKQGKPPIAVIIALVTRRAKTPQCFQGRREKLASVACVPLSRPLSCLSSLFSSSSHAPLSSPTRPPRGRSRWRRVACCVRSPDRPADGLRSTKGACSRKCNNSSEVRWTLDRTHKLTHTLSLSLSLLHVQLLRTGWRADGRMHHQRRGCRGCSNWTPGPRNGRLSLPYQVCSFVVYSLYLCCA